MYRGDIFWLWSKKTAVCYPKGPTCTVSLAAKGYKVFSLRKINKVKTWLPISCLFSVAEKS